MPTYEYECGAGHRYETREGFDAPATQKCLKCRRTARRVLFAPPIVFKGSGFYVTDSRKAEPASATSSESKSEGAEGATSDTKSEASSDGKSETKSDTADKGSGSEPTTTKAGKAPPKADKAAASS